MEMKTQSWSKSVASKAPGALAGIFILSFFAGCGARQSLPEVQVAQNRTVDQAPLSDETAGVVVHVNCDEGEQGVEQLQNLVDTSNVSIRKVNPERGLYEVYGADAAQVAAAVPSAQVEQNKIFRTEPVHQLSHDRAEEALAIAMAAAGETATAAKCIWDDPHATIPSVEAESDPTLSSNNPKVYVQGTKVALAAGLESIPLTYAWVVDAPRTSLSKGKKTPGKKLTIQLDQLGGYYVFLVGRDGSNRCAVSDPILMGATYTNAEAFGGKGQRPRSVADTTKAKFPHLNLISAWEAQAITKGAGVKIAIVDSGVTYNHPHLSPNLILKQGALVGKNFVHSGELPQDDNGHGSHVAGLSAGAVGGVAPNAQVIPVKAMNALGMGDLASIAGAIEYAADQGADIINLSLGQETANPPKTMADAIAYARKKGALIVTAAGNYGSNNDLSPNWPANFSGPGILSVAAVDNAGVITDYSNFGTESVDIAAPGGKSEEGTHDNELLSHDYLECDKGSYARMSGTSMASPVVAGVAALVMSANKDLSAARVKEILLQTGSSRAPLKEILRSGKIVNALKAVQKAQQLKAAPAPAAAPTVAAN